MFGPGLWWVFLDAAREAGSPRVLDEMLMRFSSQMTTLFNVGYSLGLPAAVSSALQMAGAAVAITAVWFGFRRYPSSAARTALLATATFLVSPYALNYDLLLLMPAVVALFRLGAVRGFLPGERLLHAVLWLLPLAGMVLNRLGLPLMPLAIVLLGVVAWRRLQPASKVELPDAAGAR